MSKCISNWGEFSEHEYTGENATCDYCGQVSEMIAVDQLQTMRAALVAIQELHGSAAGFYCDHCSVPSFGYEAPHDVEYPCPTRRLADDALHARTTKNGENK